MSARTRTTAFCALGAAALACTLAGCSATQHRNAMAEAASMNGSARHCAESGQMYRLYRYFPDNEVYQSVYHYRWFWQEGEHTYSSQSLPEKVALNREFYVLIELPTTRPFAMHGQVIAQYPSTEALFAMNKDLEAEMMGTGSVGMYATVPTDH